MQRYLPGMTTSRPSSNQSQTFPSQTKTAGATTLPPAILNARTPEQCIPLPPVDPNPAPLIPHSTYPSVVTWTLHVPQPLAAKRFASSRLPSVVSWTLHPPRPWSQLPSVVTWTQRHVPRHPPRAQGQDTAVQSDGQATKSNGDLSAVWSARASVVTWNSHNASWREGGGARVT
eukprot:1598399-Rhodomonas_salina.6